MKYGNNIPHENMILHSDASTLRQEIVFIGQNIDEEHTRETLDGCLLSDAEMAMGMESWKQFEDPFPQWFANN